MNESGQTQARRLRLGYAIVLLGAAGFVVGSFLPYLDLPHPEPPSGSRSLPERTLYRDHVLSPVRFAGHLGGLLSLFGGVAVIATISMLRFRGAASRWAPGALAVAIMVWSLPWIGWLLLLGDRDSWTSVTGPCSRASLRSRSGPPLPP